jgi:hypothetical protein
MKVVLTKEEKKQEFFSTTNWYKITGYYSSFCHSIKIIAIHKCISPWINNSLFMCPLINIISCAMKSSWESLCLCLIYSPYSRDNKLTSMFVSTLSTINSHLMSFNLFFITVKINKNFFHTISNQIVQKKKFSWLLTAVSNGLKWSAAHSQFAEPFQLIHHL